VRGSGGAPRAASTRSGRDGVSGFLPLLPLRVAFSVGRVSFYVGRVGAAARVTGPRLPLRETQLGRCLLFFFSSAFVYLALLSSRIVGHQSSCQGYG
jgi:hypothetical protein